MALVCRIELGHGHHNKALTITQIRKYFWQMTSHLSLSTQHHWHSLPSIIKATRRPVSFTLQDSRRHVLIKTKPLKWDKCNRKVQLITDKQTEQHINMESENRPTNRQLPVVLPMSSAKHRIASNTWNTVHAVTIALICWNPPTLKSRMAYRPQIFNL